jgi:hypothetical protein
MGNQARLLPTLESIDVLMIDHSRISPTVIGFVDGGAGYGGSVVGLEFLGSPTKLRGGRGRSLPDAFRALHVHLWPATAGE